MNAFGRFGGRRRWISDNIKLKDNSRIELFSKEPVIASTALFDESTLPLPSA
jgi:hypothetical protein